MRRPGLAVADAAHRGHLRRERVAAAGRLKLVDQAGTEHRLRGVMLRCAHGTLRSDGARAMGGMRRGSDAGSQRA